MTEKLYYENLYSREFDAEILTQTEKNGKFYVTLNRTLFFPSGGGQPYDTGIINDVEVIEVFEENGNIIHVLNDKIEGVKVHGALNWERRFELMQQHLGEHLFAGSLYNLHGLHTARMRIEGENVSLDIDSKTDPEIIFEAEALANEAVWKDIPVEILYPEIDEIKLHARKLPPEKTNEPVRIVKIEGVDYVPCCGVHVNSTGQVGIVKITSFENHKGGMRIYLKCGKSAYRWLKSLHEEVRKAESELVCGFETMNEKISILKSQIHDLKILNEKNVEKFLRPIAEKLISDSDSNVIRYVMKDSSQDDIKILFRLITEKNKNVAVMLASESSEGVFIMFGCSRENKNIDVRPAFKKAIEILGGKGGGSSFSAQGWGKNIDALNNALDEAEKSLQFYKSS